MNISTMQRYARILVIVCVFLCLSLNNTFPIHKERHEVIAFGKYYNGKYNRCEDLEKLKFSTKERVSKSALDSKIDKKTKHSNSEDNEMEPMSNVENIIKNIDLHQYEQLVIMKKYPYLDMKELEMKYRPSGKTVRHSVSFESGLNNDNEPGICERRDDLLNVEISNRGLSGFAIPVKPTKQNLYSKHGPNNNIITNSKNIHGVKAPDKYKLENLKQRFLSYLDARNFA